ncbi:MAG TPA: hydrogenase iron-sulfur subunit [Anaerolineae bacterium]|nr:hydrogenase iron-sulfur subunit [Anaerolineae bacterium]
MNDRENAFHIVAYCCHYCAYAAADLAGVLRLRYPAEIKIVELPCTGRIDAREILLTLEHGADGVMIAGCLEGDCHFQDGNINARRRIERLKQTLSEIGMDPGRIEMYNLSSAQGNRFAEVATEMTERIIELGPSPFRTMVRIEDAVESNP